MGLSPRQVTREGGGRAERGGRYFSNSVAFCRADWKSAPICGNVRRCLPQPSGNSSDPLTVTDR